MSNVDRCTCKISPHSNPALDAALSAYESDLSRPKHNRGTCIEMRASARQAAIEAFNKLQLPCPVQDPRAEGLLAAADHHEFLANGWNETASHYKTRPEGLHWEQAVDWERRAESRVLLHRELAQEFRALAAGNAVLPKPPFSF